MRFLLIRLFFTMLAAPALAQEEATPPETPIPEAAPPVPAPAAEAPPDRVGRLSLVSGSVSFHAPDEWVEAVPNFPLSAGGSLRTGAQSRAEIEIGDDTIDLAQDTEIEVAKLSARVIQLTIARGRIGLALRRLGDDESVEVDFSGDGVRLSEPGRYDIDAGSRRVAVFAGSAQVVDGATSLGINSGESMLLAGSGLAAPVTEPAARDEFAEWCRSRDFDEVHLAAPYYISPDMTGFAELDAAGDWENTTEYGAVWVPNAVPADWVPYRDGHWRWIAPWGWTWIDDQPWGFAPFHYGRWAVVGGRWTWVPGNFVGHPVYAPAVVAFLGTAGVGLSVADSTGPAIAWFPLAPGEVYWPSYTRDLDYVRSMNLGNVADVGAIQMDANGEPPREVVDEHFANRRFASVVPRPVFLNGGAVASALLDLPEQRLQNAPVLMGSPQIGPAAHRAAVAVAAIRQPDRRSAWTSHIAALVARSVSRAKALQAAFAHLRDHNPALRLRGAHLRAPAYAQAAPPRHTIILRVAHAAPTPAHGGAAKEHRH
jgi:hypothetical protein